MIALIRLALAAIGGAFIFKTGADVVSDVRRTVEPVQAAQSSIPTALALGALVVGVILVARGK